MRNNMKRARAIPSPDEMLHPAVKSGAYLPGLVDDEAGLMRGAPGVAPAPGFDSRYAQEDWEMMRGAPGVAPAQGYRSDVPRDHREFADAEDIDASRAGGSGASIGPAQIQGFDGYVQNPLDEQGRARMGQQFLQAPLGGYVRDALDGQELFGHRITNGQARMAEQGLAGLTAVGIGVPAFLAAVNQLSTPQSAETIPL